MMKIVLSLELTKHRHSFLSAVLVLVLGLIAVVAVAPRMKDMEWLSVLRGWFVLMLSYGIPLSVLFFGTLTGNALRREPETNIEEPLPIHPVSRVTGAWVAGLIYSMVLGIAASLLAALVLGSDSMGQLLGDSLFASFQPYWWFLLLQVFSLSFTLSYWSRQPLLASGTTAIVVFLQCYLASHSFDLTEKQWLVPYSTDTLVIVVERAHSYLRIPSFVGAFAAILSMLFFARRLERGIPVGWRKATLIILCLTSGLLICVLGALYASWQLESIQTTDWRY